MGTLLDTAIYRHRHADYYRDQPHDLFPSLIAGLDMDQSTCCDLACGDCLSDLECTRSIVKVCAAKSGESDCANG